MASRIRCAAVSITRRANISSLSTSSAFFVARNLNGFSSNTQYRSISSPLSHKQIGCKYFSIRATRGSGGTAEVLDPVVVSKEENEEQSSKNWKIKMLYDGECPLCMREVDMLRERNKSFGTIKFVDISSEEYSPEENQGLDYETVMGRIHAILSDGSVVTDIEAFRKLYEAVGLGWVYAITKYEPIATLADAVYGFWAKYRLQITGRPPLEEVLEARKNKRKLCNDSKTCKT
ncbi:hypothetical protein ACH5RR_025640 [Cinchona calisaya]|uniref:Thiol-disulfide oxidoreductase DCC n=1 Tax=Cinchona calisaya TaxID=153742 RepID=A0ABD2Z070_9GENT